MNPLSYCNLCIYKNTRSLLVTYEHYSTAQLDLVRTNLEQLPGELLDVLVPERRRGDLPEPLEL
jgi:hypothetical protein